MPKVAYRFLPCANDGSPREKSNLTLIRDENEGIGVGSVIEADLPVYHRWEVVEVRDDSGGLTSAADADGDLIRLGGTLVCRGLA